MPQRIREQDPLKQGLKLALAYAFVKYTDIREQDPLKQGLKPLHTGTQVDDRKDSRARSIKTRIETLFCIE